jgi:hypothetical protein
MDGDVPGAPIRLLVGTNQALARAAGGVGLVGKERPGPRAVVGDKGMSGTIRYAESYRHWQDAAGRDDGPACGSGVRSRWAAYSLLERSANPVRFAPKPRDIMVQCPKCKTVETLQFVDNTMTTCRKFFQRDGKVFHDCGSDLPCRLH